MNSLQPEPTPNNLVRSAGLEAAQLQAARLNGNARAQVVNRTHRVVREQALGLREQRRRRQSLWVPLLICSSLLLTVCYAAWGMLEDYDLTPSGAPDASYQMFMFLLWSLPITAFVLGLVWIRRGHNRTSYEAGNHEAPR